MNAIYFFTTWTPGIFNPFIVCVQNEIGQKYLYLSEIFDRDLLKINHTYLLSISFDYIVEIDYEN